MKTLTDQELKLRLAEFLPNEIEAVQLPSNKWQDKREFIRWKAKPYGISVIDDTELLEICHRIEGKMAEGQQDGFLRELQWTTKTTKSYSRWFWECANATWQQRARAIIEVLGQPNDK